MLGVTRRDIASLINEKSRPTEETTSTGISPARAGYNRANEDLYAILYLLRSQRHASWPSTKTPQVQVETD